MRLFANLVPESLNAVAVVDHREPEYWAHPNLRIGPSIGSIRI
jgi:hypothetical protein